MAGLTQAAQRPAHRSALRCGQVVLARPSDPMGLFRGVDENEEHRERTSREARRFRWQGAGPREQRDRKSTRLNSSHEWISYAVFCLKKKKKNEVTEPMVEIKNERRGKVEYMTKDQVTQDAGRNDVRARSDAHDQSKVRWDLTGQARV